jgi:hypothetical protein
MNNTRTSGCLIAMAALLWISSATAGEQWDERDLRALTRHSDLLVLGLVHDTRMESAQSRPLAFHTLEVTRSAMDRIGAMPEGTRLTVAIPVSPDFPLLAPGVTCVIWLRWSPALDAFIPAAARGAVFTVDAAGNVLNGDGYYLLDVRDGRPVAGPRSGNGERAARKEQAPVAVVTDIEGRATYAYPAPKVRRAQEYDPGSFLDLERFLDLVQESVLDVDTK